MINRQRLIRSIRLRLERDSLPRLQMSFLVAITGAVGFIASYFLLQAGLTQMWARYLIALVLAYMSFLFLLWLWLCTKAEDYTDIPDLSGISPSSNGSTTADYSGTGGEFGGGGASGSFDSTEIAESSPIESAFETVAEADELAIPLFLIITLVALAVASLWVVYSAPVLFAELLLDTMLAAGLYRKLRKLESRSWLETAIRRTFLPFLITAIVISTTGWWLQANHPSAESVGEITSIMP
jgi:polyferredoxin